MVGTRQLARILDLGEANGTKVVLVGDHRQLPEINAGGAFAALGEELSIITLRHTTGARSRSGNGPRSPRSATATRKSG